MEGMRLCGRQPRVPNSTVIQRPPPIRSEEPSDYMKLTRTAGRQKSRRYILGAAAVSFAGDDATPRAHPHDPAPLARARHPVLRRDGVPSRRDGLALDLQLRSALAGTDLGTYANSCCVLAS